MKFEQFLNREAVPEWRPKYLNYHLLKEHLRAIPLYQPNHQLESAFFADFRLELHKATQFYADKQRELLVTYNTFKETLSKRDLINLYTEIDFLKNFQLLNSTAVKKILKKFVKVTGNAQDAQKFDTEWIDPNVLDRLTTDIEDLFTRKFANSDRHRAMRRLRTRNLRSETFHTAAWIAGLLWGTVITIIAYLAQRHSTSKYFYIFTSQIAPFLALALLSINCLVFKQSFVNYQFVFQFDKRTALHESQFSCLTGFLAFILVVTWLIMFSIESYVKSFNIMFTLLPLIIISAIFMNPSPWPWISPRIWTVKTLFRIISAPFPAVVFKDFFINDHLISQTYFLQGILKSFGIDNWSVRCIGILPNATRTWQCLRRFKDTKIKLNLLNAAKYIFVIIIIILRVTVKIGIITDIFQACSTLFSLYWDLVMDFGLLQSTNTTSKILLRDQLVVFTYKLIYYYMITFNCIARFSWILLNYNLLSKENTQLLVAVIEVFRRFHWTFLRIEYEHLNNCNLLKAVDDLKLPKIIDNRTADLFYKDMVSESRLRQGDEAEETSPDAKNECEDEEEDIYSIMESSV